MSCLCIVDWNETMVREGRQSSRPWGRSRLGSTGLDRRRDDDAETATTKKGDADDDGGKMCCSVCDEQMTIKSRSKEYRGGGAGEVAGRERWVGAQ